MTVLLLTDRLINWALTLSRHLSNLNIRVLGIAENKQQLYAKLGSQSIDYLIIVGYLEDTSTYEVLEELKSKNILYKPVQWAILDALIMSYSYKYNISLQFDRRLPYEKFVDYLWENLNNESDFKR